MEINLVGESLKFLVLGMSIVGVFLVVLVEIIKLQAKIIDKYFPEKAPEVAPISTSNAEQEAHHVAAIIAAVTEFRKKS